MCEQVNSLQADKADLEARISQLEQQLEHERDERAKKQYEGYEADKITGTAMVSKAIQTAPVISTEEPKIVSNKAIQTAPVISTEEPKIVVEITGAVWIALDTMAVPVILSASYPSYCFLALSSLSCSSCCSSCEILASKSALSAWRLLTCSHICCTAKAICGKVANDER